MQTAEQYFLREFKDYLRYKDMLLNSNGSYIDPRVGAIMNYYPTTEQQVMADSLRNQQYALLKGLDIGCDKTLTGDLARVDFLKHILPRQIKPLSQEYVEYCTIRKCTEPYFSELENVIVELGDRISYSKRITGTDGEFLKDDNGNYLTQDFDIPQNSRVIRAKKNIHLPRKVDNGHNRMIPYSPSEGFGYLDYEDTPEGRVYLYYIPRTYIYPLNLHVMVLSTKAYRNSSYYTGRMYMFNRGVTSAYLYTMPYSRKILKPENVVFALRTDYDYSSDIKRLESLWQKGTVTGGGFIYPLQAFGNLESFQIHRQDAEGTLVCSDMSPSIIEPLPLYEKSLEELIQERNS